MKKLHSLTFCALITPVLTLGASSLLAQAAAGQQDRQQPSTQQGAQNPQGQSQGAQSPQGQAAQSAEQRARSQQGQGAANSPVVTGEPGARAGQPGAQSAADRMNAGEHSRAQNRGFIGSVPDKGMHASKLIGAEVKTSGDENLGDVSELIINEDGQIVAIVVGVGGFLGMGQRDVAIGWDDVTRTSSDADGDDLELQVNLTRESLRSAPEYKARD